MLIDTQDKAIYGACFKKRRIEEEIFDEILRLVRLGCKFKDASSQFGGGSSGKSNSQDWMAISEGIQAFLSDALGFTRPCRGDEKG